MIGACRLPPPGPSVHDSAYLRAARGEAPAPHPGLVHAAGRSVAAGVPLPARGRRDARVLHAPGPVVEITLQPVRRYGVDAAIFFSDIVLPIKAVGVDLDIVPGVGPVVASPVTTFADVAAIPDLDAGPRLVRHRVGAAARARARGDAVDRLRRCAVHRGVVPRRGRAVQGAREDQGDDVRRPGRVGRADDARSRRSRRRTWRSQVEAGASAVQLFDSWAGAMSRDDYRRYAMPYSASGARRRWGAGSAADPLRGGHRGAARADGGGRRRRRRRRLAGAARRRHAPASANVSCRATSTRRWCSRPPR